MDWMPNRYRLHVPPHLKLRNEAERMLRVTRIARVLMFLTTCGAILGVGLYNVYPDAFLPLFLAWIVHIALYLMLVGSEAQMALQITAKLWLAFGEEAEEEIEQKQELTELLRSEQEAREREEREGHKR